MSSYIVASVLRGSCSSQPLLQMREPRSSHSVTCPQSHSHKGEARIGTHQDLSVFLSPSGRTSQEGVETYQKPNEWVKKWIPQFSQASKWLETPPAAQLACSPGDGLSQNHPAKLFLYFWPSKTAWNKQSDSFNLLHLEDSLLHSNR